MFVLYCMACRARSNKALLPAPKAPLNKIVKNNFFTLISPIDYSSEGGKLAAGPFLCFPVSPSHSFFSFPTFLSLTIHLSLPPPGHPSSSPLLFLFSLSLSLFPLSLCLLGNELLHSFFTACGGMGFLLRRYWNNMWLMGAEFSIAWSSSAERGAKQLNMAADNGYESF